MKKRLLSLFLAAIMMLSLCTGCGAPSSDSPDSGSADSNTTSSDSPASDTTQDTSSAPADGKVEKPADFPTKDITVIVSSKAGGSHDNNARALTTALKKYFGVNTIIEYKEGSSGLVGMTELVNSDADGYTFAIMNQSVFLTNPWKMEMPFDDPLGSIDIILPFYQAPRFLAVGKDFPADTIDEFVEEIKANPGKYLCGQNGVGGIGHMGALMTFEGLGIEESDYQLVPYSDGAELQVALLGGHVDFMFGGLSDVQQYVESGDFKVLLSTGAERGPCDPSIKAMTEVPCNGELGLPVYNLVGCLIAPKGIPEERLAWIRQTFAELLVDEETQAAFAKIGLDNAIITDYTCEETEVYFAELYETCGELLKKYGFIE